MSDLLDKIRREAAERADIIRQIVKRLDDPLAERINNSDMTIGNKVKFLTLLSNVKEAECLEK